MANMGPNRHLVFSDLFRLVRKFRDRDYEVSKPITDGGAAASWPFAPFPFASESPFWPFGPLLFLSSDSSFEGVPSLRRQTPCLCRHTRKRGKPFVPIRYLPSTILSGRDFCFYYPLYLFSNLGRSTRIPLIRRFSSLGQKDVAIGSNSTINRGFVRVRPIAFSTVNLIFLGVSTTEFQKKWSICSSSDVAKWRWGYPAGVSAYPSA